MRPTISCRYSGQQKSFTSSELPVPPPPVVDRPNPMPRTPVSTVVLPFCGSATRPRLDASLDVDAGVSFATGRGLSFGSGITIAGCGFGVGRATLSAFGCAVGSEASILRPPIVLRPPDLGPGVPPRLIVMTAGRAALRAGQMAGTAVIVPSTTKC